jgi:hypothetical protein
MTSRLGYLLLALAVAAEICLIGWWAAGGDSALAAPLELGVLTLFGLAFLTIRYGQLKRQHLAEIRAHAAAAERTRLAEDMHDILGHELTLIALEAGRLQVTRPEVADDATRIRERTGSAVARLREIVGILGESQPPGHPASESLAEVIESSSLAGMSVVTELGSLGNVTRPVELTLTGLVREALTNAARHAPGATVTIRTSRSGDLVTVEVSNPSMATAVGTGSGLASWRRRTALLSGAFDVRIDEGVFRLRATLPADTRLSEEHPFVRPPLLRLAYSAGIPSLVVLAILTAFWSWSSHDAELSAHDFARVRPGQTTTEAMEILPEHQARIRLNHEPAIPAGAACRTYTDGNFPLAQSTYRICFAGGVVVTAQDLR